MTTITDIRPRLLWRLVDNLVQDVYTQRTDTDEGLDWLHQLGLTADRDMLGEALAAHWMRTNLADDTIDPRTVDPEATIGKEQARALLVDTCNVDYRYAVAALATPAADVLQVAS